LTLCKLETTLWERQALSVRLAGSGYWTMEWVSTADIWIGNTSHTHIHTYVRTYIRTYIHTYLRTRTVFVL
jgi:hypothetical protein